MSESLGKAKVGYLPKKKKTNYKGSAAAHSECEVGNVPLTTAKCTNKSIAS